MGTATCNQVWYPFLFAFHKVHLSFSRVSPSGSTFHQGFSNCCCHFNKSISIWKLILLLLLLLLLHLVGVADWAKWMSLSLGWPHNDQSLTCNVQLQLQPDVVSQNVDYYYVHYDDDGASAAAADDDDVADVEDVWTAAAVAAATVVSREDFDCNVATPHCPRCQVGSGYWFSAAT